ncbi:MAG: hypothetical protein H6712_24395 [Myxococcales bacterium]|nr:hypothetical protein [Myxococcales bacterium]
MRSSIREIEPLRRRLTVVLWIVAVVSGLLTYWGLAALLPRPKAILLALVSVILATTSWGFLIAQWGRGSTQDRHQLTVLFAMPVALLVCLTSTFLAFYGMALPEAQRRDLVQIVDEASTLTQELERRRSAEQRLIPVLEAAARSYRDAAEEERASGRYSGRRGRRGSVFAGLETLASSFEEAARVMQEDEQDAAQALRDARTTLLAMRGLAVSAAADANALREASLQFEQHLLRLNAALTRAGESPVENVLSVIEGGLAQQQQTPITARRAKHRRQEAAGQKAVARMAHDTERRLEKVIGQLDRREIPVPMLRLALPFEAIAAHLEFVFPYLAYAVAIDLLLPVIALLMLGFVMQRLPQKQGASATSTRPTKTPSLPLEAEETDASTARQDPPLTLVRPPGHDKETHEPAEGSALARLIERRQARAPSGGDPGRQAA